MATLEAPEICRVLNEHGVRYVVIGGMAAVYHGTDLTTEDVDITPSVDTANLDRLATALAAMNAQFLDPDGNVVELPEPRIEPELMLRMRSFRVDTRYGVLDVSFRPGATDGYDDLVQKATFIVIDSVAAPVADLHDVIRSKEAAGRPKDIAAIPALQARAEEIDRHPGSEARIPVDPARYVGN